MKRIIEILPMLAALLFVTACSNDTIEKKQEQSEGNTVKIPFTATVNDLTTTRATLDGSKEYIFEAGDKLYVEGTGVYGILTLADGEAGKKTGAKFSGALTCSGTPSADLALTATLVSTTDAIHTISGEKVTATSYGTAIVFSEEQAVQKFSHFTGSATYGTPSFTLNQQSAFVSFDITLKDGTASSSSVAVSISNGGAVVRSGSINTVTIDGNVKARFVAAFPGGSTTLDNATVTLDARTPISFGGSTALAKNKIYTVTKGLINISTLTSAYTAQNGDLLFGTLAHNIKISIAAGATVTLDNVVINGTNHADYKWAGITCLGDATIVLKDGSVNTVTGFYNEYPGIQPARNATGSGSEYTLTIKGGSAGTGKLTAYSHFCGAGIGGGYNIDCGNIRIEGGDITAKSFAGGSGIGSGCTKPSGSGSANCGTITITGGKVNAIGSQNGAGIGCGDGQSGKTTCGVITISGGEVTATGGVNAAGIGSGHGQLGQSICSNIIISGGKVMATGGDSGAGIGTGNPSPAGGQSSCGDITITGGEVLAMGGIAATGIGCIEASPSSPSVCGNITITKGTDFVSVKAIRGINIHGVIGNVNIDGNDDHKSICGKVTLGNFIMNDGDLTYPYYFPDTSPGSGDDTGGLAFQMTTTKPDGTDEDDHSYDDNTWIITPMP